MNLKTERFEMRLDQDTLERVDAWRSNQPDALTRAEAIRRLVDRGLMGSTKENFALGQSERLIVWLITELMKTSSHATIDKSQVNLIQEAIYGGHYWALSWEMSGIFNTNVDSPKDVAFVVDVLEMWTFIESGFSKLSASDKARVETEAGCANPRFLGFDGNHETSLMGIAQFMVKTVGRFTQFKDHNFNSHMLKKNRYHEMLVRFKAMRKNLVGRSLSADELITLLSR